MMGFSGKRISIILCILVFFIIAAGTAIWIWTSSTQISSTDGPEAVIEGFSFMGVGRNTPNDQNLRRTLESSLGSIAIETRVPIDLEKNHFGFLKTHFPQLDGFNQMLNDATGARVEHAAARWIFRYAQTRNAPFKYVEFVFSDRSSRPLYIQITTKDDRGGFVGKIREKFNDPEEIPWSGAEGRSLAWRYEKDVLVASIVKDRFGNPEYHTVIYFTENIEGLIEAERAETARQIEMREKATGSAF